MINVLDYINTDCLLTCPNCEAVFASEEVFAAHAMRYGCLLPEEIEARGYHQVNGVWQAQIDLPEPNLVGGPIPTQEESKAMHERIRAYMAAFVVPTARMEGADDDPDLG